MHPRARRRPGGGGGGRRRPQRRPGGGGGGRDAAVGGERGAPEGGGSARRSGRRRASSGSPRWCSAARLATARRLLQQAGCELAHWMTTHAHPPPSPPSAPPSSPDSSKSSRANRSPRAPRRRTAARPRPSRCEPCLRCHHPAVEARARGRRRHGSLPASSSAPSVERMRARALRCRRRSPLSRTSTLTAARSPRARAPRCGRCCCGRRGRRRLTSASAPWCGRGASFRATMCRRGMRACWARATRGRRCGRRRSSRSAKLAAAAAAGDDDSGTLEPGQRVTYTAADGSARPAVVAKVTGMTARRLLHDWARRRR